LREIKFRAWDKKSKGWRYWVLGRDCMCDLEIYDFLTHYGQYTGLKDKNGKEIFDGDIVDINGCKNRVVEWDEDWCGFYLSRELNPVGYFLSEEYEIIGNIYENPELLGD